MTRSTLLAAFLVGAAQVPCTAQSPRARLATDLETRGRALEFQTQIFAGAPNNYAAFLTDEYGSEAWTFSRNATTLQRLADIQPGPAGSAPRFLAQFRGRVYFSAATPNRGREIWSTDGTSAGTKFAFEVLTGSRDSNVTSVALLGNKMYFAATSWTSGRELWSWDGTNLQQVIDLNPGSVDGINGPVIAAHGKLWFGGTTGRLDRGNLFVSDGTAAGTKLVPDQALVRDDIVADIVPGPNGTVLYDVPSGNWSNLYSTDGTAANTRSVFAGLTSTRMQLVASRVLFNALDVQFQAGVYAITNGTARRLASHTFAGTPVALGNLVYYSTTQSELWQSDGTAQGTTRILTGFGLLGRVGNRLLLGTATSTLSYDPSTRSRQTIANKKTRVLGIGASGLAWLLVDGNTVYSTDGTQAGTQVVSLFRQTASSSPTQYMPLGDRALVRARVGANDRDTYFRMDRDTLTPQSLGLVWPAQVDELPSFRGRLWGRQDDAAIGVELVGFDTTTLKPVTRIDVEPGITSGSPSHITPAGRLLYVMTANKSLYVTNGSPRSVRKIGSFGGDEHQIHAWGERAIVVVKRQGFKGDELWVADAQGATRIASAAYVDFCASRSSDFTFFVSTTFENQQAFISDGTVAGTRRLYLSFTSVSTTPIAQGVVLGNLYLMIHGSEAWISLGSSVSSRRLIGGSWNISQLVAFDDTRAAFVMSSNRGSELMLSNGSVSGTRSVLRYPQTAPIENLASHGQRWLSYSSGDTLYVSDGSASGTFALGNYLDDVPTYALAQLGDKLVFTGADATRGIEPHVVTGLGPMTQQLGEGCGRGSRMVQIRSQAPKIGSTVTMWLTDGPTVGAAIFGIGRHDTRGFEGPDACWIHFDLRAPITILSAALTAGQAVRNVRIPNDANLRGISIGLQALVVSNIGSEASPGLVWYLD